MTNIVILIPGILGSQLRDKDTQELIWPGTEWEYVWGLKEARFEQLKTNQELVADNVIESYYLDQYIEIIEPLENLNFQRIHDPANITSRKGLYVFAYDWRKDIREASRLLSKVIETMKTCASNPEITLLCHSMGGLVARYYLESEELNGIANVKRVVFMGTPHLGAPKAFWYILGQDSMLWLTKDQVKSLSDQPNFCSIYQLLPTQTFPFLTQNNRVRFLNIYQPESGVANLDKNRLEQAKEFHSQLNAQKLLEAGMEIYCFYTPHYSTIITIAQISKNKAVIDKSPDAGDGTVPVISAWLTGTPGIPVENEHSKIYASKTIIQNLNRILLNQEARIAAPDVTVSLAEHFITEGSDCHVKGIVAINPMILEQWDRLELTMELFQIHEEYDSVTGKAHEKAQTSTGLQKEIAVLGVSTSCIPFTWHIHRYLGAGKYAIEYRWKSYTKLSEFEMQKAQVKFVVLKDSE